MTLNFSGELILGKYRHVLSETQEVMRSQDAKQALVSKAKLNKTLTEIQHFLNIVG